MWCAGHIGITDFNRERERKKENKKEKEKERNKTKIPKNTNRCRNTDIDNKRSAETEKYCNHKLKQTSIRKDKENR